MTVFNVSRAPKTATGCGGYFTMPQIIELALPFCIRKFLDGAPITARGLMEVVPEFGVYKKPNSIGDALGPNHNLGLGLYFHKTAKCREYTACFENAAICFDAMSQQNRNAFAIECEQTIDELIASIESLPKLNPQ